MYILDGLPSGCLQSQCNGMMCYVQGKVSWIEAYGAFVEIALKDGRTASGLIHKSELSWGAVIVPETIVTVGTLRAFIPLVLVEF
jgi:hypothetical protein